MSRRTKVARFQEPKRLTDAFRRIARDDALRVQHGVCRYCDEPMTFRTATSDHVEPRSKGGLDRKANILAACRPCNQAKGSMPFKAFLALVTAPHPVRGSSIAVLMTWSRRRINRRLALMDATIARATGRPA